MALFHLYADDSGKFDAEKCEYTALCGYVAHSSEWQRVQLEWENLRLRWQVPPIHMRRINFPDEDSDWKAVKSEWGESWQLKRGDMLMEFAQLIGRSSLACVGAVVDAKHYRSLSPSPLKEQYPDSVALAFHQLVMRGIEKIETIDDRSPISLVIDDDRDTSLRCHQMLNYLKRVFPKVRERVVGICYVNDKAYPGIQAADMIAYESRRLMVNRVTDPLSEETDLYRFLTFLGVHQPKMYTPDFLDELQERSLNRDEAGGEGERRPGKD